MLPGGGPQRMINDGLVDPSLYLLKGTKKYPKVLKCCLNAGIDQKVTLRVIF